MSRPTAPGRPQDTATSARASDLRGQMRARRGPNGEGKPMDRLVGGIGTLHDKKPEKSVGRSRPSATTLIDDRPSGHATERARGSHPDKVYAVSAYLLLLNGIVPEDATLDADTLAKIKMPNRDGFVGAYRLARRESPNPSDEKTRIAIASSRRLGPSRRRA